MFALVVGKDGIKFKHSDSEGPRSGNVTVNGRNQKMTLTRVTMDNLVDNMGGLARPVIDQTGLTGIYDLTVEWTPEFRINNNPQPGDISVFTAVQESLGLKLETRQAPVEILVIDSIEAPSEN